MRVDISLTNGRMATVDIPGVEDVLDLIDLLDDDSAWISATEGNTQVFLRTEDISSVALRT